MTQPNGGSSWTPEDLTGVIESIPSNFPTVYCWDYEVNRKELRALYERAKVEQWNAQTTPDWSINVEVTPDKYPDERIPFFGTPYWEKLTENEKQEVRVGVTSWSLSQFMHGEQGALLATAKIVKSVPNMDAKFYAATQVMDEARHVEVYHKYLTEKLEGSWPITPPLRTLLDAILTDSRWDMTYLGMQILVEGLALAAFGMIYQTTKEPLIKTITQYIMADEARHVAFGVMSLRDIYPEMSASELKEREEFTIEATMSSEQMRMFRKRLFTRIVPTVKDIGLWGEKVQKAFADMGAIEFADVDSEELLANDNRVAEEFDAKRFVQDSLKV
jgi:hypothetical protein